MSSPDWKAIDEATWNGPNALYDLPQYRDLQARRENILATPLVARSGKDRRQTQRRQDPLAFFVAVWRASIYTCAVIGAFQIARWLWEWISA